MAHFELNTRFDAIICAYQSVNHLLSFPAWESFFGCVYDHLDEDGVFVFDIATVGYLRMMVGSPRIVQQFGDNYLVIRVSMTDELVFRWHIEVFELQPDGRYRLLTQNLTMRSFPLDQIRTALRRVFVDIELLGGHGGPADEDSADRVWFACRKRAQPGSRVDRVGVGSIDPA
jgi:hypothetical protein